MRTPPFFVLEGIDGAGKSTQAGLLAGALEARGHSVVRVRDPGGTGLSDRIRALLLSPGEPISPAAELCLYAAARAQLVDGVVRPALDAGKTVVSDRFTWSTHAYQGAGRGLDAVHISALEKAACGGVVPAHVFLLDLDPAHRGARLAQKGGDLDRMEREDGEFFRRVRAGFLALAEARPGEGTVIDAARPAEEQHAVILQKVLEVLGENP